MIFKFLILIWMLNPTKAMIGYDCGTTVVNVTTISLLEVEDCQMTREKPVTTRQEGYLLEQTKYSSINVYQCKVELIRNIFNCGVMTDYVSVVSQGFAEYIYPTSQEACRLAHDHGSFQIGNHIINGLKKNITNLHSVTLAGKVNQDGDCTGTSYSDPFGSWDKVVVNGIVKITLTTQTARVELNANKIILNSGTTCTLTDEHCVDSDKGHSYWKTHPNNAWCDPSAYSILYRGQIDIIKSKEETLYSVEWDETSFTLAGRGTKPYCGNTYTLIATEHPRLFIKMGKDLSINLIKKDSNKLNLFTYINAKFVYVSHHLKGQLISLYNDVMEQKCNLERQILTNTLAIATFAPDEFALRYLGRPGYMAVIAGEVIHLVQCTPAEVKLRHTMECYNNMPIIRGNTSAFITPRTHIITKEATQVPCNVPLPQYFRLEEGWFKFTPRATEAMPPQILKPKEKTTWMYKSPANLAISGIYTNEDLEQMRERIMFPLEKPAILSSFANRAAQYDNKGQKQSFLNIFTKDELETLAEGVWSKTWGKFTYFGTISAGIIGILAILQLIKTVADAILHGYTLHAIYGWSIHLLAAVWNGLAANLIRQNRQTRKERREEINEITTAENMDIKEAEDQPSAPENQQYDVEKQLETNNIYPTLATKPVAKKRDFLD